MQNVTEIYGKRRKIAAYVAVGGDGAFQGNYHQRLYCILLQPCVFRLFCAEFTMTISA